MNIQPIRLGLVHRTVRALLRWGILFAVGVSCYSPAAQPAAAALRVPPSPPPQSLTRLLSLPYAQELAAAAPPVKDCDILSQPRQQYSGRDLAGWEVVVGDGIYAAPGEAPVALEDIETAHSGDYSTLRANVQVRGIMAHNITFKRILDPDAINYSHSTVYQFMLPYQPDASRAGLNGETIEGHLSVWDGANTRLEYIVAFQWVVNPGSRSFGDINIWQRPGKWKRMGYIDPRTNWGRWHTVQMMLNASCGSVDLQIDGVSYRDKLVTQSHSDWGSEVAAILAAEAISMYPGAGSGALHEAYFRNWSWVWGHEIVYLPSLGKGY